MRSLVSSRDWSRTGQANRDALASSRSLHPDFVSTGGFIALAVYSILVATGRARFLPYHAIVEFIVAAVSLSAFYISWHTRKLVEDDFMTFIGITQLYVGLLTVLHLLGYNGMGILWPWNPNAGLGAQFWIILRAVTAVGLVIAPFLMGRNAKRLAALSVALGLSAFGAAYAVLSGVFPTSYAPGVGLTPFKLAAEIAIVVLLLVALSLLRRRSDELPQRATHDLQAAIVLMIVSEVLFMTYGGPFDAISVFGHVVHVSATYFLYHALIVRRLEDPFSTLFRRLHGSERIVRSIVENVGDGVTLLDLKSRRYVLTNPKAAALSGFTVDELQGFTAEQVLERVHPDDRDAAARALLVAQQTKEQQVIEYRWRVKSGEYRWFRHQLDLASDEDGRDIGMVSTVQDVTDEIRASQHRAFLDEVSHDFASYSSPSRLLAAVSERLAGYLGVEVVYFLDIDEPNDSGTLGGFSRAQGSLPSGRKIDLSSVVTPEFRVAAAAGETIVIDKAEGDSRASRRALEEFHLGSAICIPLSQDGEWRFLFAIAEPKPRQWRADEVELTREVGSRLYWRVQRARTEIDLRESEARQAFLLQLTDGLAGLGPDDIRTRSARFLGEFIHAAHASYAELTGDQFTIHDDYSRGTEVRSAGTYSVSDFPHAMPLLRQGRPLVIPDVARSELLSEQERELFMDVGVCSFASAPIVREGRLAAVMTVSDPQPRTWSRFQVGLIQETAERAWATLVAARAQEEIQTSLERTKLLQRLAASAASSLDSVELSRRALSIACEHLGAELGAVYLLQNEGTARAVALEGGEARDACSTEVDMDAASPLAEALRTGEIHVSGQGVAGETNPWTGHKALQEHRVACVPLTMRGEVTGLIGLAFRGQRPFDQREVELYAAVADQLSVGLENARLYEVEHGIAETLQETLVVLPTHVPGVHFSRAYESATYQSGRVGGDFIDVFEVRGNIVAFTLGDVSGKGIDAAVTTSLVRNTIRVHAADGLPPAQVAIKANLLIRRFTEVESFVTLWFGLLNTKTGQLRYISAGHPPALIVSRDGRIADLSSADPILGVLDDATYFERQTILAPGDRVVLYSDGVTEARSPGGGFLGDDGLRALIRRHRDVSTSSLSDALMTDVISLSEGVLRDDAAILVVEPSRIMTSVKDAGQMQAFTLD